MMGLKPQEIGINVPDNKWESVSSYKEDNKIVSRYAKCIRSKIFKSNEHKDATPSIITNTLLQHCEELTKETRVYLENNPLARIPKEYPGRLDHATCLAVKVSTLKKPM